MNTKRYIFASVAVFVFVFVFDFLVHGMLFKGMYEATKSVWRPEEECNMLFMIIAQVGFSFMFAFIFTRNYQDKGMAEGIRYGLYIGLLIGVLQIGAHVYLPIPLSLPICWMISEIVKGVGAGAVVSCVYKN